MINSIHQCLLLDSALMLLFFIPSPHITPPIPVAPQPCEPK